jgi:hypothetical protein
MGSQYRVARKFCLTDAILRSARICTCTSYIASCFYTRRCFSRYLSCTHDVHARFLRMSDPLEHFRRRRLWVNSNGLCTSKDKTPLAGRTLVRRNHSILFRRGRRGLKRG